MNLNALTPEIPVPTTEHSARPVGSFESDDVAQVGGFDGAMVESDVDGQAIPRFEASRAVCQGSHSTRPKAALFADVGPGGEVLEEVYGAERLERLRQTTDLYPVKITSGNIDRLLPKLRELEVIFSTWGMLALSEAQLEQLPNLRVLFYAAGSIRPFGLPFLHRGISVVSGASANAVPVAEFTLGQILLANKGYFRNIREYREQRREVIAAFRGRGNYGATVALLGAGQIGRVLIALLRPYNLRVIVFDPFLSEESAEALGVRKVGLQEAFEQGDIVSNHLADVPETKEMLTGELFRRMPANATFINTGRGGTVKQEELTSVCHQRPDLTALLDVTEPEPLAGDSPLWSLPNVHVSGHIAGTIGDERGRIVDLVLQEFERWKCGAPLQHEITLDTFWRTA